MIPRWLVSLSGSLRRVGWWCLVSAAGLAVVGLCALLAAWVGIDLPEQMLTDPPDSPRVTDAKGRAILTLVGPDDQWRLDVPISRMSPWLAKAAVATEDERFYLHEGIDPIAAVRAISQNALLQYRFSGASTITMQTCRLKDPNRRTWRTKIVESIRALKLEQHWPKGRILEAWLNLAPMGGNVQGVEAAAWQYFGKSAAQLSLGESALLVGLAQSPSRYRPDRHLDRALGRQRVVLKRMLTEGYITQTQYQQAVDQPIQLRRTPNLRGAPHAAWMALSRRSGGGQICLDLDIQDIAYTQIARGLESLPDRTQAAAVIIDIESAGLVAMVGSPSWADPDSGQVNFAAAWRSPGSALKPFVYAAAMQAGRLRPDSTVYDVPIVRGAWQPENFDRVFRGEVSAAQALRDSLNIPAILVAEAVGIERCTGLMRACGIQLPDNAAARGQLAAVTGAVEVRLLELTNGYATLGRGGVHRPWRLFVDDQAQPTEALVSDVAAAINRMLSLTERTELAQPDGPWCMWKTGTSSGRRDAWAVGQRAICHRRLGRRRQWPGAFGVRRRRSRRADLPVPGASPSPGRRETACGPAHRGATSDRPAGRLRPGSASHAQARGRGTLHRPGRTDRHPSSGQSLQRHSVVPQRSTDLARPGGPAGPADRRPRVASGRRDRGLRLGCTDRHNRGA